MPRELDDWGPTPEERNQHKLDPDFRIVFILRDVEELSIEETAKLLGLSITATKSRLLRARLKLRQRLNRYFREGEIELQARHPRIIELYRRRPRPRLETGTRTSFRAMRRLHHDCRSDSQDDSDFLWFGARRLTFRCLGPDFTLRYTRNVQETRCRPFQLSRNFLLA